MMRLRKNLDSLGKLQIKWTWILCLLPIIVVGAGLMKFPYPSSGAAYSDMTVTHYPNALYIKQTIAKYHTIPLWSDLIMSGYPFVANPLSGLLYPPGWIALLFPLPLGINLVVIAHLVWAGLGLFLYLRQLGLHERSALFGGIAYELMPKTYAHYAAGHVTLVYALAWLPWLFIASDGLIRREKNKAGVVYTAIVFALIFLADVRWIAYAGGLWFIYMVAYSYRVLRKQKDTRENTFSPSGFVLLQTRRVFGVILLAILLSAPLLLPFLEFLERSTRAKMGVHDALLFSLPPVRLMGMLFPDFEGFHEWVVYYGGIIIVLVLVAVVNYLKDSTIRFWIAIGLITIFLSIGGNIPVFNMLYKIPGINLLRIPPRSLFVTGFAFSIISGFVVERLFWGSGIEHIVRTRLLLVGLLGLGFFLALGVMLFTQEFRANIIWGMFFCVVGTIFVFFASRNGQNNQNLLFVLLLFAVFDLLGFAHGAIDYKSPDQLDTHAREIASVLSKDGEIFRVYSPSYSIPQNIAAEYNLELADGVDPLQLRSYALFMVDATGVPPSGYQVTIPPFANGNPREDNKAFVPDTQLLGILNVKYIVSEYELQGKGLEYLETIGESRIYKNLYYRPRVWMDGNDINANNSAENIDILVRTPNRIVLKTKGAGIVTLSEIYYPGWIAKVDGNDEEIITQYGILRGVEVDDGEHNVEFVYKPRSFMIGVMFFLIGILYIGFPKLKN